MRPEGSVWRRGFARLRAGLSALATGLLLAGPLAAADPCADHVPQPKPQNAGRDIVGQDLDAIVERGFLTIALYEDFPPYSWREAGQARGIDADIGRLLAEAMGVEARFRFTAAGEDLEADLRNAIWKGAVIGGGVSNVMMRVPYDSAFRCRVEQVVFPGQYQEERLAIAYRRDAYPEDPPVPAYFRFDSVAVENDSIADFYLTGFAGGQLAAGVRRYPDMRAAMAALAAGETMAAMGPRAQLDYFAAPGVAIHEPPLPGLARSKWVLGTAVHFAYRPLAYTVGDTIEAALADGRIEEIFAAYGVSLSKPQW